MLIALIAKDKEGGAEIRAANRPAHLAHLKANADIIAQAGAMLDDDGNMIGSLVIIDAPDMQAARDWAEGDPYAKAGLFTDVQIVAWNRVIG